MKNTITFSDGSSVGWVDKETLRYSRGTETVLIWVDFEPGFFSKGRVIKASSIKKWESHSPSEPVEISDHDRDQVIDKIKKYYEKHRVKYRIET